MPDESLYESYIIAPDVDDLEDETEEPSLTYRLDFENNRIVGRVDELDAVVQAARKALMTPRFKALLYSDQYGSEIEDVVTKQDATPEFIAASIEWYIQDALLPDNRIESISDIEISLSEDSAWFRFRMDTIFGDTEVEGVV